MLAAAASKVASTVPDISIGHAFFQMVIALGVIALCAWGGTKLLARLRGHAGARPVASSANGLTVLSRQPLGKGLQIAVVRWGAREVLVGISGSTITFLSDPRAEESELAGGAPTGDASAAFSTFGTPSATQPVTRVLGASHRPFLESLRDATSRR